MTIYNTNSMDVPKGVTVYYELTGSVKHFELSNHAKLKYSKGLNAGNLRIKFVDKLDALLRAFKKRLLRKY